MMPYLKPPLGVSPHWFVHTKRIEELNEAIGRYIAHIKSTHHIGETRQCFEVIVQWAKEIEGLATLEMGLARSNENDEH